MLLVENNLGWSVVTLTAAILKMKGVSRYSRYEQSLPHQSDFSSLSLEVNNKRKKLFSTPPEKGIIFSCQKMSWDQTSIRSNETGGRILLCETDTVEILHQAGEQVSGAAFI